MGDGATARQRCRDGAMVPVGSLQPRRTVSAVIVGYNSLQHLRRFLPPLEEEILGHGGDVILVDNASTDGTRQAIPEEFFWVRLIANGENRGYAAAVNQGIRASAGELVLIMNPDVTLRPGAIAILAGFMEAHPHVGIAAPRLLNPDGTQQPSCRRFHTLTSILSRRGPLKPLLARTRWASRHLMLEWDHGAPHEVDWVLGACMLVRRSAVLDVGPMDEGFFLYFEDEDWCHRMWAHGWAVRYVPSAEAIHEYRRESDRLFSPAYSHFVRSGIRLLWKYGLFMARCTRPRKGVASS